MTPRHRSLITPIAALLLTASLFAPWTPLPQANRPFFAAQVAPAPAEPSVALATNLRQDLLVQRIVSSYSIAPAFARRVVKAAHDIGERERVDPVLLLALVGVESRFNPKAKNASGAIGLTQTIPRWHPEKVAFIQRQGKPLTDPEANLRMGAKILAEYTQLSRGDQMRGLQRYNGSLKDPRQAYAKKVMGVYSRLAYRLPGEDEPVQVAMEQTRPLTLR